MNGKILNLDSPTRIEKVLWIGNEITWGAIILIITGVSPILAGIAGFGVIGGVTEVMKEVTKENYYTNY